MTLRRLERVTIRLTPEALDQLSYPSGLLCKTFFFFFLIIRDVRVSLRVPRLISQGPEVKVE